MKKLLRRILISMGALWITSQTFPALVIHGGFKGLIIASLAFMAADILLVPLLKILFLPLNLLTLGLFAWITNVLALFFLAVVIPEIKLMPYFFPGFTTDGFAIPSMELSTLQVAAAASFMIGFVIHLLNWLSK